jgi:hypothetical protein
MAKDTYHLIYYDKTTRKTFYIDSYNYVLDKEQDYGFADDLEGIVPFFPFLATSDRAYCILQAVDLIATVGVERATELGIKEDDNPVIVVATLKK